jgi:dTDP-4-dehydrorhamnose 3,5-epimerase
MRIEALPLAGLHVFVPEPVSDIRGSFARCFSRAQLAEAGLVADFDEWSLSYNIRSGTVRGLHWQAAPHVETKLVQCVRGAVFDVAVDLRTGSPTLGRWHALELSAENRLTYYIPQGFAHGFQTLTDNAEVLYHISTPYHPEAARGVRWNDPDVSIRWPEAEHRVISERDAALPYLAELHGTA